MVRIELDLTQLEAVKKQGIMKELQEVRVLIDDVLEKLEEKKETNDV